MGRRETKTLEVADRLRAMVRGHALAGSVSLPPVDSLVHLCGASRVTLLKVLHRLAVEGLLEITPGKGMILGPAYRQLSLSPVAAHALSSPVAPTPVLVPKNRFDLLLTELRQDILASHYGHAGALPSAKVLCEKYGVGHTILRRALLHLTAEKYLALDKKHFRVARPAGHPAKSTLVVIAYSHVINFLLGITPRSGQFWSYLEDERQRLNVSMMVIDSQEATGREHYGNTRYRDLRDLHAHEMVLGYVVLRAAIEPDVFEDLVAMLAALKSPTVIIDEGGDVSSQEMEMVTARFPTIRYFGVATSERAGHDMGTFLLRSGHRRVAYFSALERTAWARNRLSGLIRAFSEAGVTDGVVDLLREVQERVGDIDQAMNSEPPVVALRQALNSFAPALNKWSDEGYYIQLNMESIREHTWSHFVLSRSHEALEAMVGDTAMSACVCCNDIAALIVMGYLKEHPRPARSPLSVLGFDNSDESLGNRLTTYDFNTKGVINAALAFIVDGRDLVDPSTHEIPGYVVERETHQILKPAG